MDFNWPIGKIWHGYDNPWYSLRLKCAFCDGSGNSARYDHLKNQWYGFIPFDPRSNGSKPFEPDHPVIQERAKYNVSDSRGMSVHLGSVAFEARRLAGNFNTGMMHHLNQEQVDWLVDANRLYDFPRTWSQETGWVKKDPPYRPTAKEVNEWSIQGMGHDSINCWTVIRKMVEKEKGICACPFCNGEGGRFTNRQHQRQFDRWKQFEPPVGEGWQLWENTSEGSPVSPVFATPQELSYYLAKSKKGAIGDNAASYEQWMALCRNGSTTFDFAIFGGRLMTDLEAVVFLEERHKAEAVTTEVE